MASQSANHLVLDEIQGSELEHNDQLSYAHSPRNSSQSTPKQFVMKKTKNTEISNSVWVFKPQTPVNSREMFSLFETCIIIEKGYEIIDRTPQEAIIVKIPKKSCFSSIRQICPCFGEKPEVQSFKFVIHSGKNNRVDKIIFKGLTGSVKSIDDLFDYFKLAMAKKDGIMGKGDYYQLAKKNKKSFDFESNTNLNHGERPITDFETENFSNS